MNAAATNEAVLDRPAEATEDSAKRRQIIEGARQVFLARGFDAASMSDIAKAAGVSKGTLYVYFKNKDELFKAIVEIESVFQPEAIVAKPGEEEAVARGLEVMIEPTMAEPGVKLFLPYRSPSNPRAFFIFELYVEEKSWADHQQTDHFRGFVEKIVPRLEKRERVPYVPYAAMSAYRL